MLSVLGRRNGFGSISQLSSIRGRALISATARVGICDGLRKRVDPWNSTESLSGLRYQVTTARQNGIEKQKQKGVPGYRDGSIQPPGAHREDLHGQIVRGKLLTTPSRLLKVILPLSGLAGSDKDIEPLALLVHPQQPLSHLERLIQAEVPPAVNGKGEHKKPAISFMVLECQGEEIKPKLKVHEEDGVSGSVEEGHERAASPGDSAEEAPDSPGTDTLRHFVRWSLSTEIGDFIRDAAKVKEFAVVVEYSPREQIQVAVPSFNDRTYYLRMRLRKTSRAIADLNSIKKECDNLAHRGAQRIAMGGFGILAGWWCLVYQLTFGTELGWDTMEPVTYLVSLSTLMGGYLWFLYHNREVSYRTAFNLSINRRQAKLYQSKGLDLQRWETLVDEANTLRKEIKAVAAEYDVDWNEKSDEQDEAVTEALKKERREKNKKHRSQSKEREGNDEEDD
ncbi:hypothetical protein FQN54_000365 [Arachnomyces sp. PD_36]|nr:hypothetical protein FQN54_000365 [Arachnomyces sp. PD_36]